MLTLLCCSQGIICNCRRFQYLSISGRCVARHTSRLFTINQIDNTYRRCPIRSCLCTKYILEEFGVYVSILDLHFSDQDVVMVKPSKNEIVFHIIYIQFNKIVSTFL